MKESEGHTCKGVQVGETGWSAVAGNGRLRQTVCMGVIDICCLQYLRVTAIYFMHQYQVSRSLQDCQFNKNMLCINNLIETCFVFYRYFEEHFASTLQLGWWWVGVCLLSASWVSTPSSLVLLVALRLCPFLLLKFYTLVNYRFFLIGLINFQSN